MVLFLQLLDFLDPQINLSSLLSRKLRVVHFWVLALANRVAALWVTLIEHFVYLALDSLVNVFMVNLLQLTVTFLLLKWLSHITSDEHTLVKFDSVNLLNQVFQLVRFLEIFTVERVKFLGDLFDKLFLL